MNQKELPEYDNESDDVKRLIKDINANIRIFHNGDKYIEINKLTVCDNNIVINDHLPQCVYYGSCWLIKNNSILQVDSNSVYESCDIRISEMKMGWRCVITIHNLDLTDVSDFQNMDSFRNMDELVSNDSDKSNNFIIALIKNGFKLYTR